MKGLAHYLYKGLEDADDIARASRIWLLWKAAMTVAVIWIIFAYSGRMPKDIAPNNTSTNITPAIGELGFNVEGFCNNSGVTVYLGPKDPASGQSVNVPVPDAPQIKQTYTLDGTIDGIHGTVDVTVYVDPNRQPNAIYHGPDNTPIDGFVSKAAMDCIDRKAK